MSSLFALRAPCPLFGPSCDAGDWQTLSFQRSTKEQNSAGELLLSFAAVGSVLGELQPRPAGVVRVIHGVVLEVAYTFFVQGAPDIRELDRTTVDGAQLEVVTAAAWGEEHMEVDLKHLGR